jgi:site-specific DNA-methyltransferase (adenine-specific)
MINKSYLGDCFDIHSKIQDESIDLILTDPPYGTTRAKWDTSIDLEKLWIDYERIIKPNGVIVIFSQTPFDKVLGASNLNILRYEWIWEKTHVTGHLNAKKMPMKSHENILVFYKRLPVYNAQITEGHIRKVSKAIHKERTIKNQSELYNSFDNFSDYDSTSRYPRDVLKFPSDRQKLSLHPTQKPLLLCEYLIKTYTNEGGIVLDSFGGSGTIARAAKNLKRNYITIETNEKYFDATNERLIKLIGE